MNYMLNKEDPKKKTFIKFEKNAKNKGFSKDGEKKRMNYFLILKLFFIKIQSN